MIPPEQRRIRAIARDFNLPILQVEDVKRMFDSFDTHSTGVDQKGFDKLLTRLLRIPEDEELPHNRLMTFWREIDSDGNGFIDFEEFLPWYITYFPLDGSI